MSFALEWDFDTLTIDQSMVKYGQMYWNNQSVEGWRNKSENIALLTKFKKSIYHVFECLCIELQFI
jgi:hypothetical protein